MEPRAVRETFVVDYRDADGKRHRIRRSSKSVAQAELLHQLAERHKTLADRYEAAAHAVARDDAQGGAISQFPEPLQEEPNLRQARHTPFHNQGGTMTNPRSNVAAVFAIIRFANLDPVPKLVLAALGSHLPRICCSYNQLAHETGLAQSSVALAIQRLEKAGHITKASAVSKEARRHSFSNVYSINWAAIPVLPPRDTRSAIAALHQENVLLRQQLQEKGANS